MRGDLVESRPPQHQIARGTLIDCVGDDCFCRILTRFELIGHGCDRVVYADDRYVVKFDKYGEQNEREIHNWESRIRGSEFERYFAPIIAAGNRWLIMPRMFGDTRVQPPPETKAAVEALGITDIHWGNVVGGVVVDYGEAW